MAEATALWELLRQTADPSVTDALKSAVETGSDRSLTLSVGVVLDDLLTLREQARTRQHKGFPDDRQT